MIQTYLLTLLAPLFFGGNTLLNSKLQSGYFFSKDYTTILKGLCCIIVIYVHVKSPYDNVLQDAIGSFAYVCVTIFFLISAYGMMMSVERKKNYLKHFWRNRLISLLIPCLLVNIIAMGLGCVKNECDFSILWNLNSYVAVLLQWCVWFYIVELLKKHFFPTNNVLTDSILIAGVLVSSLYNYFFIVVEVSAEAGWCFERVGLVWGVILYRYFDRIVEWMDKSRMVKVMVLGVLSVISGVAYLKFKMVFFWGAYLLKITLGLVLILLFFTVTSNRIYGDKMSWWLGSVSFEVYLSHHMVMSAIENWLPKGVSSGMFIFFTVLITLVFSTIIHFMGKRIVNRLRM